MDGLTKFRIVQIISIPYLICLWHSAYMIYHYYSLINISYFIIIVILFFPISYFGDKYVIYDKEQYEFLIKNGFYGCDKK